MFWAVVALVDVGVFGVAAWAKFAAPRTTQESLVLFGAPAQVARRLWWLLPLAELLVAVGVAVDGTRRLAAAAGVALLLLFSAALAVQIRRGVDADCGCFGAASRAPISPRLLWRNAGLVVVGLVTVAGADRFELLGWADGWTARERGTLLLAASAGVAALALAVHLRQLQRSHDDLAASVRVLEALVDGRDGLREVEALPSPAPGLPVGVLAPRFERRAPASDDVVGLDDVLERELPVLLLFVGGGCHACIALLPSIEAWGAEGDLTIVLFVAGADGHAAELLGPRRGVVALEDPAGEVGQRYDAAWTPAGVVLGADGRIASRTAYGAEGIGALVEFARENRDRLSAGGSGAVPRPPGVAALLGEPAPALDVLRAAGAPTPAAVLFWSNSCGFCEQLAPELLAYEVAAPPGAPPLVVVAPEPPAHPLGVAVVVDRDRAVSVAYGSPGTPSAVLLDPMGAVASEVVAGAPLIRRLLDIEPDLARRHVRLADPRAR